MPVTYTRDGEGRPRSTCGRGHRQRRLSLLVPAAVSLLACATGGSPLPRGAPPLAAGSTPEPVRYEVVVPGARPEVQVRVARLLADSLFHVNPLDVGVVSAVSLARFVKVRVDFTPQGKDSVRVGLTGETYLGDTARRDSVSGLPERWRLLTATDASSLILRGLARSLRLNRFEGAPADSGESGSSDMDRSREGSIGDPRVAAVLAATPVGRDVDVCRSGSVPIGWLVLYWYVDRSRCTIPEPRYPAEPNMMRIEREW
jgi:hypothetical protein